MGTYSIKDITKSADRHKLYILLCSPDELSESVAFIQSQNLAAINIGKELASFIDELDDYRYLNIDVNDFLKKLLDKSKTKINAIGNDIVSIYNFGILIEPSLELNAVQLLKEFSKSASLIIIWENEFELNDKLNWPTQKNNFFLDFSETQLKKLQYAI